MPVSAMYDFSENTTKAPENYRYNEDHVWMEYSDTGYVKCGVTEYLCEKTGDIESIEYIRNILNMEVDAGEKIWGFRLYNG